jgi:hypothetical protein
MMCPKCGYEIKEKMDLESIEDDTETKKPSKRDIEVNLLDDLMKTLGDSDLGQQVEIIVSKRGPKKKLEDL